MRTYLFPGVVAALAATALAVAPAAVANVPLTRVRSYFW
jgi:hypothetical protein